VTIDETTLTAALRDLAATATDDPGRLRSVHHLARRLRRRHRAVGAGAIAATMAAAVVGADAFASSGHRAAPILPAAAPLLSMFGRDPSSERRSGRDGRFSPPRGGFARRAGRARDD